MNITDVDDKTIKNSQIENKTLKEFTEFYTQAFLNDIHSLNILPANKYTRATDYIAQMVEIIQTLLKKGYAYKEKDGSIYFDISKDKDYGKLSRLDRSTLKENAKGRLKADEYEKENAFDFALWKIWDEKDGDVFWETSIGKGRPGWHIECSAMSMSELGETFDIHTGGVDNIFPHHENEIAQSECSTDKIFAHYFLHNEHLLVDGQKMSKSLGNFYTMQDFRKMGIDPIAFRMLIYTSHYQTKTNFTLESVNASKVALDRLRNAYLELGDKVGEINKEYKDRLIKAMDNNLDPPKSMTILWNLLKDINIKNEDKKATLLDFDKVFGFGLAELKRDIIPNEVEELVKEREIARTNKDWKKSDELRNKIKELGYEIKDTDTLPRVSKI
jgi:cysteinyl-tRNA synthetase